MDKDVDEPDWTRERERECVSCNDEVLELGNTSVEQRHQ